MQRRAAAAYAAFFVLIAAGSYGMIAASTQPTVAVDAADKFGPKTQGDTIVIDGRSYTVGEISGGSTKLTWVNESERKTETISNGTELAPVTAHWPGQAARYVATLDNGTTIRFDGNETELVIAGGDNPSSFALVNTTTGNETTTVKEGDTFRYRENKTTVTAVTSANVTLVWGDPYQVLIPNVTDPSTVTFRQVRNVTAMLMADPAVENKTVTRANGKRYVVYAENGSTQLLSTYNPADEKKFAEGDTFVYKDETVRISNVTASGIVVSWRGPVEYTRSIAEGDNVTIDGTKYVAHFDGGTLKLSSNIDDYQHQLQVIEHYHERVNGLWGVSIVSGLAAIALLAMAYLPSRY